MIVNRTSPPIFWKEYTSFSADIDLRADSPGGKSAAAVIKVVTAGSGNMAVHMTHDQLNGIAQLTSLTANESLEGQFTQIRADNSRGRMIGFSAAQIALRGGLTDGDTMVFSVDGGGNETATFNTGDFVDIASPTLAELKTVIEADTTAEFDATGTFGILETTTAGAAGSVQMVSGDALAKLGFSDLTLRAGADTDVSKVRVGWSSQ